MQSIKTKGEVINGKSVEFCRGCDAYLGEPGFSEALGHTVTECLQQLSRRIRLLEES